MLAILYLMIPIVVMIVFSFNRPDGQVQLRLERVLARAAGSIRSTGRASATRSGRASSIAVLSTIVATILGTMIGLALTRYQFRGRGALNGIIFLPMATPEIVLGASLLTLFVAHGPAAAAGQRPDPLPDRLRRRS